MKKYLFLLLLGFISFINAQEFPVLKGDYLGQTPPGNIPVIFARGIVSSDDKEHWAPRFSPDGNKVFWWSIRQVNDKWLDFHKTMRRVEGKWSAPEVSPFDNAPIFSPDGKRLYFGSKNEGEDLYYVEKEGNRWSKPKSLSLVTRFPEVRFAYFPTITRNGTLYFMGYLEGQRSNIAIYRSQIVNGEYVKPELLPKNINTPGDSILNWTPYIAPDENYLIFCRRRITPKDDYGDLYICFRQPDGSWADPVSLGEPINSKELERFPYVSPDGKYLFFTRDTNLPGYVYDEDVYWVSAKIIDRLREKYYLNK